MTPSAWECAPVRATSQGPPLLKICANERPGVMSNFPGPSDDPPIGLSQVQMIFPTSPHASLSPLTDNADRSFVGAKLRATVLSKPYSSATGLKRKNLEKYY